MPLYLDNRRLAANDQAAAAARTQGMVDDVQERYQQATQEPEPPSYALPDLASLGVSGEQSSPVLRAIGAIPQIGRRVQQQAQSAAEQAVSWALPTLESLGVSMPKAMPVDGQMTKPDANGQNLTFPGEAAVMPTSERPATMPQADGDYRAYARQVAQAYGLDPDIFERQINQESGFRPWGDDGRPLGSPAGAQGIAQFMPATAAGYGVDVNDPYSSLDGAARHMRDLLQRNNGDYRMALAAYNAGQGNVDKYGEGVFGDDFANGETKRYVTNILGSPAPQMQRVSLNAGGAPPPATPQAPARVGPPPPPPPPPGGFPSPPAGPPPAPWANEQGGGETFMKAQGEDQNLPAPNPAADFPLDRGRPVRGVIADEDGVDATNEGIPYPGTPDGAQPPPGRVMPFQGLPDDAMYRQPLSEQAAFLPGDGGTPPQPEYDPRVYDEGPREWTPPAPVYADPTASDPSYSEQRQPDPIQGPAQPEPETGGGLKPVWDAAGRIIGYVQEAVRSVVAPNEAEIEAERERKRQQQAERTRIAGPRWSNEAGAAIQGADLAPLPLGPAVPSNDLNQQVQDRFPNLVEQPIMPTGVPGMRPTQNVVQPPRSPLVRRQDNAEEAAAEIERDRQYSDLPDNPMARAVSQAGRAQFFNEPAKRQAIDIFNAIQELPFETYATLRRQLISDAEANALAGTDPLAPFRGLGLDLPSVADINPEGRPASDVLIGLVLQGALPDPTDPLVQAGFRTIGATARGTAWAYRQAPGAIRAAGRESAETLARWSGGATRGLQGVGREVAGGLMDLNPAMTPRVTGEGPGIGRALASGAEAVPERPVYNPEPAPGVQRRYHGTAGAFERPDPSKFDENGLYGPGYYTTSDPRVASSYASMTPGSSKVDYTERVANLENELLDLRRMQRDGIQAPSWKPSVPEQIARAERALAELTQAGPNVRAVDVPGDLRLLDVDAPLDPALLDQVDAVIDTMARQSPDVAERLREATAIIRQRLATGGVARTNDAVVQELFNAAERVPGMGKGLATEVLQRAGYDGIAHKGGQRVPMFDSTGQPIEHDVTVIFPDRLDRVRNAFSGEYGGAWPSWARPGSGLGTRVAADVGASIQGAGAGALTGAVMPADSDEERMANIRNFGLAGMVGMPVVGRAVGRGMRRAGPGMRTGIVPPHVADQMAGTFPVRVPQDPKVIRAIESIGGTVDPERGVTINVTRAQGPQAAGQAATRGGVFYEAVPEGGRSSFVRGSDDPTGVGGSQVIPARPTRFRSPLIVSDAPGGTQGFDEAMRELGAKNPAPDSAAVQHAERMLEQARAQWERAKASPSQVFNGMSASMHELNVRNAQRELDALYGFVDSQTVNRDIRNARAAGPEGSEARAVALKEVVRKYGGDPELIDPLLRVRGADASESEWAIRENILAAHARRNGYDGVVTVEQASDMDTAALHQAAASHPQYQSQKAHVDALEAEMNRLEPGTWQWDHARADWEAATNDLDALLDELVQSGEIAPPARITELVDVREGANPTPGAPPREVAKAERALKAAQTAEARAETALLEAKREWTLANPRAKPDAWNQSETAAPLIDAYWESRRAVREAERAVEDAKALPPVGDPGFSVRADIPRPAGANWAGVPFDPASAAMGGAAGAMSEGEDGEPDPLRTAAGVFVAGLGNSRYGRRFLANAARRAQQGPPPNLWEVMQGFRFSWGMLGNLAQTGLVNVAGGPVELAKGLPTEAIRMSILHGRPIGTAHYAAEVASGLKDGARNLLATVLGEIPPSVRNAPDFRPPLSERMAGRMGQVGNVDAGAVVGEAIDLPGRLASQAPDSLWRPFFLRAGAAKERNTILNELGVSKLDPAAQWRELQRLTNNPTPAEAQRIAEASRKHADEMGLKGDDGYAERWLRGIFRPGGRITTSADPMIAQVHEAVGSFLMPFLGAIYKLHKLAATGVPGVGFLANSKLPLDEKVSRQIVGAGMAYLMADYAAQGMITGPGPSDPDEAAIVNKKMPPNSTYVPGVGWVPNDTFSSAGPYLNAIGAYYDARRYATEKEKTVAGKGDEATVQYVLRGFERFPVVQAVQSIIAMGESPIKGVSDFAANAASSFVPAPYRTYQASQDQYARTTDREAGMDKGIVPALAEQTRQKIVSRAGYVPGLGAREDLAPALDRFGRPIENDRQGAAAFLPRVRNPQDDALTDIFTRAGIEPGMPPAEVDNIPLTTEQKREWQRVRGESLSQKQDILSRAADYPEVRRKTVFDAQMSLASDRAAQAVRRMFTSEQRAAARKKAS